MFVNTPIESSKNALNRYGSRENVEKREPGEIIDLWRLSRKFGEKKLLLKCGGPRGNIEL